MCPAPSRAPISRTVHRPSGLRTSSVWVAPLRTPTAAIARPACSSRARSAAAGRRAGSVAQFDAVDAAGGVLAGDAQMGGDVVLGDGLDAELTSLDLFLDQDALIAQHAVHHPGRPGGMPGRLELFGTGDHGDAGRSGAVGRFDDTREADRPGLVQDPQLTQVRDDLGAGHGDVAGFERGCHEGLVACGGGAFGIVARQAEGRARSGGHLGEVLVDGEQGLHADPAPVAGDVRDGLAGPGEAGDEAALEELAQLAGVAGQGGGVRDGVHGVAGGGRGPGECLGLGAGRLQQQDRHAHR